MTIFKPEGKAILIKWCRTWNRLTNCLVIMRHQLRNLCRCLISHRRFDRIWRNLLNIAKLISNLPKGSYNLLLMYLTKNLITKKSRKLLMLPIRYLLMRNLKLLNFSFSHLPKSKKNMGKLRRKLFRTFRVKLKDSSTLTLRKRKLSQRIRERLR